MYPIKVVKEILLDTDSGLGVYCMAWDPHDFAGEGSESGYSFCFWKLKL